MKIKSICPVIGMISSGKSSILNALFNMDYLEAKPEVTTKIVTIIRYNSLIKIPRFFHLTLKNDGNDNYIFYKDSKKPEVTGKENIIKEVNERNEDEGKKKEPKYDDIFYMLEIGEVNFIEEEFLKSNDFADIPGVSEKVDKKSNEKKSDSTQNTDDNLNLTVEELSKNVNLEKEITYLTQIFKILKNKMNTGIIIFSVDNFNFVENYKIMGTL